MNRCPGEPHTLFVFGISEQGALLAEPASSISSQLSPKYFKKVPGEGMPLPEDPEQKGDLFIFFDIQFPTHLTPQKKRMLRQALLT